MILPIWHESGDVCIAFLGNNDAHVGYKATCQADVFDILRADDDITDLLFTQPEW